MGEQVSLIWFINKIIPLALNTRLARGESDPIITNKASIALGKLDKLGFSQETIERAIDELIMNRSTFPTPQEIINACYAAQRGPSGKFASQKHYGCPHCKGGTVYAWDARYFKERPRCSSQQYVLPCAYCHEGETSTSRYYIQHHDRIAEACTSLGDGLFVARFDKTRLQPHDYLKSVYTDADLSSLHNGKVITSEQYEIQSTLKGAVKGVAA